MLTVDPRVVVPPTYAFEPGEPLPDEGEIHAIWRYMDFTKFVSLLAKRSLYFARADRLGDPWEGSLTRMQAQDRRAKEEEWARKGKGAVLHATSPGLGQSLVVNRIVSCWHANEVESMAMWRLYLSNSEGIAIQSTFEGLAASLPAWDGQDKGHNEDGTQKELRIRVRAVEYVDYDSEEVPTTDRIFMKRRSFSHEREVRAVATDRSWGYSPRFTPDGVPMTRFLAGGDYVPVQLETLVEKVYVSPDAQPWFADLVRDVIQRYGLGFPVQHSNLSRDPVF